MQLVARGLIDLRRPICDYIPYFGLQGPQGGREVTAWHLLTHYGGMPHTFPKSGDGVYETLEELVRKSAQMRQLHPAGTAKQV